VGSVVTLVIIGAFVLFVAAMTWALNSRTAGERGWVFNKHNPRRRGMGSLGLLESIYQPSIEHVVEERSSERARGSREESGDKPEPGREDPGG
jgi:hypothetical protein